MNYSNYNRQYYLRTKDNLSEEVKQKRREQARLRQKAFYENNKELVKMRIDLCRIESEEKKLIIKTEIEKLNQKITNSEIKFIKSINLSNYIKLNPRLKIWHKKISDWTFKDYNKLILLTKN